MLRRAALWDFFPFIGIMVSQKETVGPSGCSLEFIIFYNRRPVQQIFFAFVEIFIPGVGFDPDTVSSGLGHLTFIFKATAAGPVSLIFRTL